MTQDFYGATVHAELSINKLLSLPASGKEQDWEVELADPSRIEEMLDAAENVELDFDERCALTLLTIASIDEFLDHGKLDPHLLDRASSVIRRDKNVCDAMVFYWIALDRATNKKAIEQILISSLQDKIRKD